MVCNQFSIILASIVLFIYDVEAVCDTVVKGRTQYVRGYLPDYRNAILKPYQDAVTVDFKGMVADGIEVIVCPMGDKPVELYVGFYRSVLTVKRQAGDRSIPVNIAVTVFPNIPGRYPMGDGPLWIDYYKGEYLR